MPLCRSAAIAAALIFALAAPAAAIEMPAAPSAVTMAVREATVARAGGGEVRLSVEIADTPETRRVGLMHRDALPAGHGMLFDFGYDLIAQMWMHDTRIPLDMVFIDAAGIVRSIHKNAKPFDETVISSPVPVRAVLEIGGGEADMLGLAVGDRLRVPGFAGFRAAP